jgi:hypothetical protein
VKEGRVIAQSDMTARDQLAFWLTAWYLAPLLLVLLLLLPVYYLVNGFEPREPRR